MKKIILFLLSILSVSTMFAQNVVLDKSKEHAVLKVDNKPFLMLSGELHNSTCSDIKYLNGVWDKLVSMNMNSVIATESWELMEPEEGKYDFSRIDAVIKGAKEHNLKVALIWFATFKNPFMTYSPSWVKANNKRFPHAQNAEGKILELPSLFDNKVIEADLKAYKALLQHIKDTDTSHTIIGIQIGNEPGLNSPTRDCSPAANKAWKADVPQQIIDYMVKNKGTMQPDIENAWKTNGYKKKGNWEEVFGKSITEDDGTHPILHLTEHLFTAYSFANYFQILSSEGKKILNVPTFINATGSVNSRGRSMGNGCSIPDFFDIYMAVAPSLDALTPNSYGKNFDAICEAFAYKNNPIFIPECTMSAVRPFYVFGEWDGLCHSPFAIDDHDANTPEGKKLSEAYSLLSNMSSLITANLNSDKMRGAYIYEGKPEEVIEMGDYKLTITNETRNEIGEAMILALAGKEAYEAMKNRKKEIKPFESACLIIQTGKDEFYIAGGGVNVSFQMKDNIKAQFCDYDYIYEGTFNKDGQFERGRLLNGDEQNVFIPEGKIGVLQVKMYHF
jgi:hypothetical protein